MHLQPHESVTETADNDNGILYLTELIYLTDQFQAKQDHYMKTLSLLKCGPGLYHRNPGRSDYVNSHDNYVAMAAGCIYFGDTEVFKEVIDILPFINNKKPGWITYEGMDTPSGFHNPSNWFIYFLAAGKEPSWTLTLFFVLSVAFQVIKRPSWNSALLCWLKIEGVKQRLDRLSPAKLFLTEAAIKLWDRKIKCGGWLQQALNYFIPTHPIRILGNELLQAKDTK